MPPGAVTVIGALDVIVAPASWVNVEPETIDICEGPEKLTAPFAVMGPAFPLPMNNAPVVTTLANSALVSATPPAASAPRKKGVPFVFCAGSPRRFPY